MPIVYAPGSERTVHAECTALLAAHPDDGADSLAVLHQVAAGGLLSLDGETRDGFGIARPYCHQAAGWGVFFEVTGPLRGRCVVTVLAAAEFARTPIEAVKREAIRGWQAAETGRV